MHASGKTLFVASLAVMGFMFFADCVDVNAWVWGTALIGKSMAQLNSLSMSNRVLTAGASPGICQLVPFH
jgi:hypothetical protein